MNYLMRYIAISIMFFLTLCFVGCGGSTTGTGGITIEGRILLSNNASASRVVITVTETGDSAVADSEANYVIKTSLRNSYTLLIEVENVSIETTITDVPADTSRVRANVEIDTDNSRVTDREVEFERKENSDDDKASSNSGGDSSDSEDDSDDEDDDPDSDDEDDFENDDEEDDSDSDDEDDEEDDNDEDDDDDDDNDSDCQEREVTGAINSINSSSINLQGITFAINSETEIEDAEGDEITFSDLKAGQIVQVEGECESNILVAKDIRIEH